MLGLSQSMPAPQGLPNNIMHPTRCMRLAHSRRMPRAGDDERYAFTETELNALLTDSK
jgi:hypothetical protein